MSEELDITTPGLYPLLPLRDVVVFPHMVIPLFVGRAKSIKALESAMEAGKSIVLVAQKSAAKDEPSIEDMYRIGSIANILQMLKLPDGTVKVLVEGTQRAKVMHILDDKLHFDAEIELIPVDEGAGAEVEAMRRALIKARRIASTSAPAPSSINLTSMSNSTKKFRLKFLPLWQV